MSKTVQESIETNGFKNYILKNKQSTTYHLPKEDPKYICNEQCETDIG